MSADLDEERVLVREESFHQRQGFDILVTLCRGSAAQRQLGRAGELFAGCGAPFGVGAFYRAEAVTISGSAKEFARPGASGGTVRSYFCPDCGSTVYWENEGLPGYILVAVGNFADPNFPAPTVVVWEQSRHPWIRLPADGHLTSARKQG